MPNWVRNEVKFGTYKVLKDCITEENGTKHFDFNKIIPMPKELADEDAYNKLSIEEKILFKKKWGEDYGWYEWANEHWGTKWNANDTYIVSDTEVGFETAWAMPRPVYKAISEKYNTTVEVEYADEGIAENSGRIVYENGEEILYEPWDREKYDDFWGFDRSDEDNQ